MMILLLIYMILRKGFSTVRPCNVTGDFLYISPSGGNMTRYCFHNFGNMNDLKDEFLYRCSNWFHTATAVSVHSIEDHEFLHNLTSQYGNSIWTGLLKSNIYVDCTERLSSDFLWDAGGETSFIVTNGTLDCSFTRDYCFIIREDGVYEDNSCDTRGYESLCVFEIPICNGTYAIDYENSCSGHGSCMDTDVCMCDEDFFGKWCEETWTCDSVRQDNISSCFGNGVCIHQDNCVCLDGFFGEFCEFFNKGHCQKNGELMHENFCYRNFGSLGQKFFEAESQCENWYTGISSHLVTVFSSPQINFLKSSVLMGDQMWLGLRKNPSSTVFQPCPPFPQGYLWSDGTPQDFALARGSSISCDSDTDMCFVMDLNYFWRDVDCDDDSSGFETVCQFEIPTCEGHLSYDSESVCHGHGFCESYNNCTCFSRYYGRFCDFYDCWGSQMDSVDVCSGHGTCFGPNWCVCDENYLGNECNMTTCDGITSSSPDVCSGHGVCISHDICDCDPDYGTHSTFCHLTYPCQDTGGGGDVYVDHLTNKFCVHNFEEFRSYKESYEKCKEWFDDSSPFYILAYDELDWVFSIGYLEIETWMGLQKNLSVNPRNCPNHATNPSIVFWDDGHDSTWINDNLGCIYWGCNEVTRCFSLMIDWGRNNSYDCPCSQRHPVLCRTDIRECFGILSSNKSVCSGNGFCLSDGVCVCKGEGYVYQNCSIVDCFGVPSNEIQSVCSGNGYCMNKDDCECRKNWYGTFCNVTSCNGIWNNETTSSEICHGHGECVGTNLCSCSDDSYFGDDCEHTYCNWIKSTDTLEVCSGKGLECYPLDNCTCISSNYFGQFCEYTTCFGIPSDDSSVCNSGGGECIDHNTCICEEGVYFGERCDVTWCNGILSNDSNVCSGFGNCTRFEICICNSADYFGDGDCDRTSCFDVFMEDESVCKSHGSCWPHDICTCNSSSVEIYTGEDCGITTCFGILGNESACSGEGDCWPKDVCDCDQGYFESNCNITACFDVFSNDTDVCGGIGKYATACWPKDTCHCLPNYYPFETCSVTTCYGVFSNDSSSVCGGHGSCWPHENCECAVNYFGQFCNISTCFGIFLNDTSKEDIICSGNGKCVGYDTCRCFYSPPVEVYFGDHCNITKCYGVLSNDTENVCSGHGQCELDTKNCSCYDYQIYSGLQCDNFSCFEINRYDEEHDVCSSHGSCVDHNKCECMDNYTDQKCDLWMCYGIWKNSTVENGINSLSEQQVCSGHGDCYDFNSCNCSRRYPGSYCHEWSCDYIPAKDEKRVCNGNGVCTDWEVCICFPGYSDPDNYCYDYFCNGIHWEELNQVCSKRGVCVSPNKCECSLSYEGDDCETWSCDGIDQDLPGTCSGHGKCHQPEKCTCRSGWRGDFCGYNLGLAIGLGVSLPIAGIVGTGLVVCIIGSVICCFCCSLFSFLVLFGICIGIFSGVNIYQKKSLARFKKLRDFELLLKEQEMEESDRMSSTSAKLKINKSLFEIDYDEIEVLGVLGKGGSDSIVYKGKWSSQLIAFKCFRTRDLCSSQEDFSQFEREVSILSSISHPNIIRFFGATVKPPRIGIIMEFCQNGDLKIFLFLAYPQLHDGDSYPWGEKMRMLKEIVNAMEFLHSRNIIHRDLKLENVLVDERETCKVMDFGLSKLVDKISSSLQKTKRVGTSVYISPEVVLTSVYDEKVDVFSFSILAFMIITENLHPYGREADCVELKVAQDPQFRPDIKELDRFLETNAETKWLKRIIQKCWNHEPGERLTFKMIGEFLIKCEAIAVGEEVEEGGEKGGDDGGDDGESGSHGLSFSILGERSSSGSGSSSGKSGLYGNSFSGSSSSVGEKELFRQNQKFLKQVEDLKKELRMMTVRLDVAEKNSTSLENQLKMKNGENERLQAKNKILMDQIQSSSMYKKYRNYKHQQKNWKSGSTSSIHKQKEEEGEEEEDEEEEMEDENGK